MSSAIANMSDKARSVMHAHLDLKPIKLYSHAGGPNPWKVAIILEELGLPYNTEIMDFGDLKKDPFEKVNPNGRVPAIEDPNFKEGPEGSGGINMWESGAIIEYLLSMYDKGDSLRYDGGRERWEQVCWLNFQTSGQGPYFGQRAWFILYHPEKNLTSCLDRYGNEIRRVIGVIDAHLKKTRREYLVGSKCTYADLAFVPWFWLLPAIMGEEFMGEWEKSYPMAWSWYQRLSGRESVKKCYADRQKAMGK